MTNSLHIKSQKKQRLVELLTQTDRRRYHTLYLCSCYFSIEAATTLVNEISELIRLHSVKVYIDRKSAIEYGGEDLDNFCSSFDGLEVSLYAVESNALFHSKSYALIAFDESSNVFCGSLVLGSANLTAAGLISRGGNIECLIDSQEISLLEEHISQLDNLKTVSTEELNTFSRKDEYSFKYALLQAGVFIHKWNDNLEQYLSIRYRLSENGRARITDHSFENAGFNIETATVSKKYFRFSYNPQHLEDTENITRNFGVETYLGFWLPYVVVESMFNRNELESFKDFLFKELEKQHSEIEKQIRDDFEYLKEENLIEEVEVNPFDSFSRKTEELRSNELKLKRIYSKYEIFYLPYDIQQKDEILELFDEMIEVAESKTRKNKTVKAFLESYATFSIERFNELLDEAMR